jgi:hypothetical protein
MICCVLLCTFVQIGSTQPLLDDDDDVQAQVDSTVLNNYAAALGRYGSNYPRAFNIPENFYDHRQQQLFYPTKQYNPDNVQLAKRIIMLPRVGRRSIRSAKN